MRAIIRLSVYAFAAPLLAQDVTTPTAGQTETVVVARKLAENVEDVPAAVTVVGREEIEDAGYETVRDASFRVPNLLLTEFTSRRLSFPFLRGIGSGQGDPSVITYVDGVPQLGTGGTNLPLVDVERIEFLRGPQSTLYGRNALGGLIHVITRRPETTPTFEGGASYGSYDEQEYLLRYSGPLGDGGPLFSFAGAYAERDGYTENRFLGEDVDHRESFFARTQVVLDTGLRSELRVTLYGESADDGGFALGSVEGFRDEPFVIDQDFDGVTERDVIAPTALWSYFGDGVDVTSITAYQDYDILETSDFDFSPLDAVRRRTEEEQSYFSQEVRVASAEDAPVRLSDDASLRWLVGTNVFLSDSERSAANEFRSDIGLINPFQPQGTATSSGELEDFGVGVWGHATVTLCEDVDVSAGLRYDHEDKEADLQNTFVSGGATLSDTQMSLDDDFDEVSADLAVAYRFTPSSTAYARAARGFKAGGFNLAAPAGELTFEPETSTMYEVGVASSWCDERIRARATAFHIDWEDMQLSLFDPLVGGYVDNAGESESQGIELELDAALTERFSVFTAYGVLDTELDEFVDPFGMDTSGNDLPFAPESTWNVGGQYEIPLDDERERLYVRGELTHVGDFFYDAGNVGRETFETVALRAGMRREHWSLELWVRNLFDEEYVPIAFQPNPADPSFFVGEMGSPRVVGLTLSVRL